MEPLSIKNPEPLANAKTSVEALREAIAPLDALQKIKWLGQNTAGVIFSTSLGKEDQVILDMIAEVAPNIRVFFLDTGRHFEETLELLEINRRKYKLPVYIYHPETKVVEKLLLEKGPLSFYESVENRLECCHIRKVLPLKRALEGHSVWITGIRREQSAERRGLPEVEWDQDNEIIKVHPLLGWTAADVDSRIRERDIPQNDLFRRGYMSIGCAPCTRAVKEGEDPRAGRWWWENSASRECGLHLHK